MATSTDRLAGPELRKWMAEQIAARDIVRLPELADEGVQHFEDDTELLILLGRQSLRAQLYGYGTAIMAETRTTRLPTASGNMSEEALQAAGRQFSAKFQKWREHAGDTYYITLNMTREDLLLAAEERENRGLRDLQVAALWRQMARQMLVGQRVSEVFTAEKIAELHRTLSTS